MSRQRGRSSRSFATGVIINVMVDFATSSAANVSWDLSELFVAPDDPRIEATLDRLNLDADEFVRAYRAKFAASRGPSATALCEALHQYEALQEVCARLGYFASLSYAADTTSDQNRHLAQHIEEALTSVRNKLLFFDLAWLALPDVSATRLINSPKLAAYKNYLKCARDMKPHTLSEPVEQVINDKDLTGLNAWSKLHTEYLAGLKFEVTQGGISKLLSQSEILVLMRHPDRSVRKHAHEVFFGTIKKHSQILTFIYDTRFQDHLVNMRLRQYTSPMQERHIANSVQPAAVDAMMLAVERNMPLAHRYFNLKARLLGLPKLEIYDQYAPVLEIKEKISYTDAGTRIIQAMHKFSPEFANITQQFFEQSWIDADPRAGKRGGAFCAGVTPSVHPFILMSYNDDLRDVMTLAHELGHGLHDRLASEQTLLNYYPSLPIAETASVFAEMLTFEELLSGMSNDKNRLALLCAKIEDSFATVFRQTVLTRFEQLAYAARGEGRLTTERICDLWLHANAPYYGDSVSMTPGYEAGWSYIPHLINTPFYCYAYSFGQLLVLALYGMYRRVGAETFVPRYRALLAAGGSKTPAEIVAGIGMNIDDPDFWQVGFDELARFVGDAERLSGTVTDVASQPDAAHP